MDIVPSKRTYKYLERNPKIKTQEGSRALGGRATAGTELEYILMHSLRPHTPKGMDRELGARTVLWQHLKDMGLFRLEKKLGPSQQ